MITFIWYGVNFWKKILVLSFWLDLRFTLQEKSYTWHGKSDQECMARVLIDPVTIILPS